MSVRLLVPSLKLPNGFRWCWSFYVKNICGEINFDSCRSGTSRNFSRNSNRTVRFSGLRVESPYGSRTTEGQRRYIRRENLKFPELCFFLWETGNWFVKCNVYPTWKLHIAVDAFYCTGLFYLRRHAVNWISFYRFSCVVCFLELCMCVVS